MAMKINNNLRINALVITVLFLVTVASLAIGSSAKQPSASPPRRARTAT